MTKFLWPCPSKWRTRRKSNATFDAQCDRDMEKTKKMTICFITFLGAFKIGLSASLLLSWRDSGLYLIQFILNLGTLTPSCLNLPPRQRDNSLAPGETLVLFSSPADFRSTDNPDARWNPITAHHKAFGSHAVTTHENCACPGAPFTCIIQHRQLGVAKPWPLHLMVHITWRPGRVSHSVFSPQV